MAEKKKSTAAADLKKVETLMEKLEERIQLICTPERFKNKISEILAEWRDFHTQYHAHVEKTLHQLSSLLDDPSIWV